MIVHLVYKDKSLAPYVTRVSVEKAPPTIAYRGCLFQNLSILRIGNKIVYQYREISTVRIEDIELGVSVPLKLRPTVFD